LSDLALSKPRVLRQEIPPNLNHASSLSLNPFKSEGGQGKDTYDFLYKIVDKLEICL
jgi:hypothetical protein